MKTSLFKRTILFLAFILSFCIVAYYLKSGINYSIDPVSLMPSNTAIIVDLKKPVDDIMRLRKSRIGIQMHSINWKEIFHDIGVHDEYTREFYSFWEALDDIYKSNIFNELFARRVLLGIIPTNSDNHSWLNNQYRIEESLIFISRPRHRASIVDLIVQFSLNDLESSVESYDGRLIRSYTYDNRYTFFTTVTEGLFIVSMSSDLLKQCIDNSIKSMTSGYAGLKGNNNYIELKKQARDNDDQFAYIDMSHLLEILDTINIGTYPPHGGNYKIYVPSPEKLPKRIVLFRQSGKLTRNYSGIVRHDKNDRQLGYHLFKSYKPGRDSILPLLPDNNVFHLWTNIFNAHLLWNFLHSEDNFYSRKLLDSFEKWLRENTQYAINDIFPLFGSQVSVNIAELKSSGIIPMPRISFYIEVLDQEKVYALLERVLSGLHVRHSQINGVDLYSIILADGLMQPSFMFYGKFLVFADSSKQLEDLLLEKRDKLLNNPLYQKTDVGLTDSNNLVLYFRNAELIDGIKELVRWYGSLLQLFDSDSPVKNKIIIERVVLPLLDGMKMYKVKTVRVYTGERETVIRLSQLLKK